MTGGAPAPAPFAVHGGRLDAARVAFPATRDWLDLSTGISPWAYPASVDAVDMARLPTPEALAALEAAAADAFGSDPAATVAVPGSDLGLRLLGSLLAGRRVAVVRPGYSGHVAMWDGAVTGIGADAIGRAAADHDVIVVAHPNNPDGNRVDAAELEAAASTLAARGGHLIVDAAFADALAPAPLPGGTIVLRSFGKFFGLAGLRLGFVVAPPAIADALRRLLGDWPVSGAAIAIGTAAYRDTGWQAAQRARLANAAVCLDAVLAAAGLTIVGGAPLFRLAATPFAAELFTHLATAAILVRPFVDAPARLRFGLPGGDADRDRLGAALVAWRTS